MFNVFRGWCDVMYCTGEWIVVKRGMTSGFSFYNMHSSF